jgi:hypothetical protein
MRLTPGEQVQTAYAESKIDQAIPLVQLSGQQIGTILSRYRAPQEGHAMTERKRVAVSLRTEKGDLFGAETHMPQQQGKKTLRHAARADD